MAERMFMYCPTCRMSGVPQNEMFRSNNVEIACVIGHKFTYESLMAAKPEMIQMQVVEKAGPGDVKAEVFVNAEVLNQFRQKHPNRLSSTVSQVLRLYLDEDLVIVDGMQARELRTLSVRTGAEMLAAIKTGRTLEGENEELRKKLEFIEGLFKSKGVEMPSI